MRFGVGNVGRGLAVAALLTGVATGCGDAGQSSDGSGATAGKTAEAGKTAGAATAGAGATAEVAARGGSIGADGSACELPVTFDIAESWKAEAVDAAAAGDGAGEELAAELADALLHQGPVTMACEVDAKPAGNIGFLRVWTGKPGDADARAVLEDFVGADSTASRPRYSRFEAGGLTGAEVRYVTTSKLLEETKEERALAVTTREGPVVLHLGGMDTEEHQAMLPAYDLAKSTLKATA
ncbi:lipoprotein [Streptomyces sp. NPDC052016]|uniref:lipoprotein n=1 Tax=Streptomyces sp. NPDC052016 TaxID=3365680 RepID=UPI0037D948E7